MANTLPITVFLPTRNSAALLPRHLASLAGWLERVEAVVVVDSFSTDGTLELLRAGIKHPNVQFHSHPPGLYQSWNFGIQQARSKYVYIATSGDLLSREGLEALYATVEQFGADVVVSPPCFVSPEGDEQREMRWPIHRLLAAAGLEGPALMSPLTAFFFSVVHIPQTVLGSSASNLYRTDFLAHRPFPEDFGVCGDSAWTMLYALEARWAVLPQSVSQFMVHERSTHFSPESYLELLNRLDELVARGCELVRKSGPHVEGVGEILEVYTELRNARSVVGDESQAYAAFRRRRLPWYFIPAAWRARARRNRSRRLLEQLPQLPQKLESLAVSHIFSDDPARNGCRSRPAPGV